MNSTDIVRLRKEITTVSWKAKHWQALKAEADRFLLEKVELPPHGGNWDHYYIDSIRGDGLVRGKSIGDWQWEHRNPRTNQLFLGNTQRASQDYDAVMVGFLHNTWALGVLELGLAYQLSQDLRYARKAQEILLAYAHLYPSLPATNMRREAKNTNLSRGKVHVQSLDEALWLVDMAQGADLIWPLLKKKEQHYLLQHLFYPGVALLDHKYKIDKIHNISCWENAAIGMVGFLANNDSLVAEAFDNPVKGFKVQVTRGITTEGFWTERAPNYHFYALQAMLTLAQAASNGGYQVDILPFKKMFDLPLQLADAALILPAVNDSKSVSLSSQDFLYEWAYTHFRDPQYAIVLQQNARQIRLSRGPHFIDWAFLHGQDTIPKTLTRVVKSINIPATGFSLLKKGEGKDNLSLYMKYTPSKGPHAHPEQLSFVLLKGQEVVAVDPGVATYAHPGHLTWYKTTAAHNTLLIDEAGQKPSTATCLAFGEERGVDYLMTETRNAYDSVRFIRTVALLSENLVLFIDQIQSRQPSKIVDIAYHQAGRWRSLPLGEEWKPASRAGLAQLKNPRIAYNQHQVSLSSRLVSGREVRVSLADNEPTHILTAVDPFPTGVGVSSVYFRRFATASTTLAWCISLDGKPVEIQVKPSPATSKEHDQTAPVVSILVQAANNTHWNLQLNPDQLITDNGSGPQPQRVLIK